MQISPARLALILAGLCLAAPAVAQHPATVFPGTPAQPGMSAPVAFPTDLDPGGLTSRTPLTPGSVTSLSSRDDYRDRLLLEDGGGVVCADHELRTRLLTMLDRDRRGTGLRYVQPFTANVPATSEIDRANLVLLKAIVAEHGWPTIAMVGSAASQAASAILLHSGDREWQERLAPELQRLVDAGKILGPDIAEIVDRLLVLSGKPQKFGTQFEIRDGKAAILPLQNEQQLEAWRAAYLLMSMSTWRGILKSTYGIAELAR